METYVYADVIILENLVMNYLILWSTAKFLRKEFSRKKLFLAALLGAIYAVFSYFHQYKYLYTMSLKILFSFLIITIAFTPYKLKEFFRYTAVFYVLSFVFGGAAFGLFYFINGIESLRNGVYLLNSFPVKILLVSSIIAYFFVRYCWDFIQYRIKREKIITKISISVDEKDTVVDALVDTGNSLSEPITNTPVIIAEYGSLKTLLPQDVQCIFEQNKENNFGIIANIFSGSQWVSRFRVIPFKSLGRDNGMLIGFKPDQITIDLNQENRKIKNIIVGIYNRELSNDGEYRALIHPDILK